MFVYPRRPPLFPPEEVSVYQQILDQTGITSNPIESLHGRLPGSLPAKPKLDQWLRFLEEELRRVSSVVAQVYPHLMAGRQAHWE